MKEQRKRAGRLTAMLMALVMVLGISTPGALAAAVTTAGDLQDEINTAVLAYENGNYTQQVIAIANGIDLTDALIIDGPANIKFVAAGEVTIKSASGARHIMIGSDVYLVEGDVTLTFENVVLDGGVAPASFEEGAPTYSGGIEAYFDDGYTLYLNGAVIQNCYAESGGGIFCYYHLTIYNSQITDNTAIYGGGIAGYTISLLTLEPEDEIATEISGNTAGRDGGGIYAMGTVDIRAGLITGNSSDADGGGVYCSYETLNMSGGKISYNNAAGNGGGIYSEYGTVDISGDACIQYNNAAENGGGVYCEYGAVDISGDSCIQYNIADWDGGGIYACRALPSRAAYSLMALDPNKISVRGGCIEYNKALGLQDDEDDGNGGGVYVGNIPMSFEGGSIHHNEAAWNGGGIYLTYSATLTAGGDSGNEVNIKFNKAGNEGGGIYTNDFDDYNDLDSDDYDNIITYGNTYFSGNRANEAYEPPTNAADYTNIQYATTSISDGAGGYVHPINNYDINYLGTTVITPETYTVTYNAIGGTGNVPEDANDYVPGDTVTVLGKGSLERSGYTFRGWSESDTGSGTIYTAGSTFIMPADNIILYAVWSYNGGGITAPATYTVTYNANGGAGSVYSVAEAVGTAHTVLPNTDGNLGYKMTGYIFRGWGLDAAAKSADYTGKDGGAVGRSAEKGNVITLYAVWSELPATIIPGGDLTDIDDLEVPLAFLELTNHLAYIVGYPDGTVQPEGNITRAEVATIFFRLLTQGSRAELWKTENTYTDVEAGAWYNNAISTLSYGRIISGYADGSFRPDSDVTRAELAAIAARFIKTEDLENATGDAAFTDISGHWAEDYIILAAAMGYVSGYPDGSYDPEAPITRAEVAELINNVLKRSVESQADMLAGMVTWPDNSSDKWYYFDMQEATNSHFFEWKEEGVNEVWTALRPAPNWSVLNLPEANPWDLSY